MRGSISRLLGRVGAVPPRLLCALWRTFALPKLLWAAAAFPDLRDQKAERAMDSVQRVFACYALQCMGQASSAAVEADLGLIPVAALRAQEIMFEWGRIKLLPQGRLVRELVELGEKLPEVRTGHQCIGEWAGAAEAVMADYGLGTGVRPVDEAIRTIGIGAWKDLVRKRVRTHVEAKWRAKMEDAHSHPRLALLRQVKQDFGHSEAYLDDMSPRGAA
eukprot:GAFH01000012.1.p1 GENE.GAFH01000012.1~~GAFH01000012.1.p1  ORF type:complete len:218 (-),score=33.57 GAFH01000012.1:461-1114(-)